MKFDTNVRSAIEDQKDLKGMIFGAKAVNQLVGYGSLCDARVIIRQPPYQIARPSTEGQALEQCDELGR